MVRGPCPAARLADYLDVAAEFRERRGGPDMVETATAVGGHPVARPIAPPSIEPSVCRYMVADDVNPAAGRLRLAEPRGLGRRVADDLEQLLVRPHVVFERRHVEV